MSKLPRISGRKCAKALERAGFSFDHQKGSHMVYIRKEPFARVVVPAHRELDTGTLRAIIRQAGLTPEEFAAFLRL